MNERICPECSTVNESDYDYCKNCGYKLVDEQPQSSFEHKEKKAKYDNFAGRRPTDAPLDNNSGFTANQRGFVLDSIDGNNTDEVAAFVGKNAHDICSKFSKMELTHSKISWCWPAAILGYLLGPLGAAIWFFYRRMYKFALILVAIGIVTGGTISYLNRDTMLLDESRLEAIIEQNINENSFNFSGLMNDIGENIGTENYIAIALDDVVNVATAIFTGLFAMYIYKRFTAKKISTYRNFAIDSRYYAMGLSAIGGTSGGMVALGIAVYSVAQTIFDLIPNLI